MIMEKQGLELLSLILQCLLYATPVHVSVCSPCGGPLCWTLGGFSPSGSSCKVIFMGYNFTGVGGTDAGRQMIGEQHWANNSNP